MNSTTKAPESIKLTIDAQRVRSGRTYPNGTARDYADLIVGYDVFWNTAGKYGVIRVYQHQSPEDSFLGVHYYEGHVLQLSDVVEHMSFDTNGLLIGQWRYNNTKGKWGNVVGTDEYSKSARISELLPKIVVPLQHHRTILTGKNEVGNPSFEEVEGFAKGLDSLVRKFGG